MKFDLYAELVSQTARPTIASVPTELASGFVDGCTSWFAWKEIERAIAEAEETKAQPSTSAKKAARTRKNAAMKEKNLARQSYLQQASSRTLELPPCPTLEPKFEGFPDDSWLAFEVAFKLETPWYAKDDRPFHVLDNPVRKDRVFGVPYLAATGWKGLLRWACRMREGLLDHLGQSNGKLDGWQDPPWIIHLFGNEKGEADDFQRGSLAFYPTWFKKIGFEVINPHRRTTRAGTQPIYYGVVPASTRGVLHLLYAPVPGAIYRDKVKPGEAIEKLLDAAEPLLTTYGISAKRTAGWGTALVEQWKAYRNGEQPIQEAALPDFRMRLATWLSPSEERDG